MIRTLLRSLFKSKRIRQISSQLETPDNWLDQVAAGSYDPQATTRGKDQLYDLCDTDPQLKGVLLRYEADRSTLDQVYSKLIKNGAGQTVRGHFVPASALTFALTLEYVLSHKDDDDFYMVAARLVQYFGDNESGPLE